MRVGLEKSTPIKHNARKLECVYAINYFILFRPFEKSGGTLYLGVLVFFSWFSKQNQIPQIIIGTGRVILS